MKLIETYFCRLYPDVVKPKYETEKSAGMDVRAYLSKEDYPEGKIEIKGGETKIIPTGFKVAIPDGHEMQVRPRSGMSAKTKIRIANSPGTVDCFSEDSTIMTINGEKNVKNITINETCFSYNEHNGVTEKDEIIAIIEKGEQEVYNFHMDDGILKVTENTLIYTKNGIKLAKDVDCGDEIISLNK